MCQKAMSSGAGAGVGAGSGKKMLGAGAAPEQAGSDTLDSDPGDGSKMFAGSAKIISNRSLASNGQILIYKGDIGTVQKV